MTIADLINASVWSNDVFICEANLFWDEEKNYATLSSKTSQKVLFFPSDEPLSLQYHEGTHLYNESIILHEVKMINRKPYYVFEVLHKNNPSSLIQPFSAIFSNETEKGITSIIDLTPQELTLRHEKPLQGRFFELKFKENNQLRHFFGKAIWSKKIDNHYVYQLLSI